MHKVLTGAAGTGKTSLLIESAAHILNDPCSSILILISSSLSAKDIDLRLEKLCPDYRSRFTTRTIKSLCREILQTTDPELIILSDFRAWFILRKIILSEAVPIQSSYARVRDKRSFICEVFELIELAGTNSIDIDMLPGIGHTADKLKDIKNIYGGYKSFCQKNNLIPEFDIIPRVSSQLKDYGSQFSRIFIDQYEDLCPGEIEAVDWLIKDNPAKVAVFADSVLCDADLISKAHASVKIDEANTRLSGNMACHINSLLNDEVYHVSESGSKNTMTIAVEKTEIDEAEYIARTIKKEIKFNRKYEDFAILCRETGRHKDALRDALKRNSIPFVIGIDISRDPGVQFILLCLQVIVSRYEDDVLIKCLSSPAAGLDRSDVYRAYTHARKTNQALSKVINAEVPLFYKSRARLKTLMAMLDFLKNEIQDGKPISELVNPILASAEPLENNNLVAINRFVDMVRDIEETFSEKPGLSVILGNIIAGLVYTSDDMKYEYSEPHSSDAIKIMSIQESKGLEFPVVFIPGMVNSFFPIRYPSRQLFHGEDIGAIRDILRDIDLPGVVSYDRWIEREKLMLYTAITRASENIYLTLANRYPENDKCEPSIFLADLLSGRELNADNCSLRDIIYHENLVSDSMDELVSSDDLIVDAASAEVAISFPAHNTFNYSSIKTFLSCPRRYFLEHLLKVETERHPGSHFGSLIHDVLKVFHSKYQNLKGYTSEELWEEMHKILLAVWRNEYGTPRNYSEEFNPLQGQSYLKIACELLRTYLNGEYERQDEDRNCILTEMKFSFPFYDRYTIDGRIDRVDKCEDYGEIIDFKTSKNDKDTGSALIKKFLNIEDDPDYRPQDFQLPIYYLAGLHHPGLNPKKLVIYQLRKLCRREIEVIPDENMRRGKKGNFLTEADMKLIESEMLRVLDRMVSGLYPPEPYDDRTCEYCDFSFLCDGENSEDEE